jgi:uncharacterized membrane protein YcaP (DUF421 family)
MSSHLLPTVAANMFHLPVPWVEKILRPVIMYIVLIAFLRLFGKRELAQLNPFDLVVLLTLSNTVQNAIIGDDNSVTGGVIGAFALLATNWLLMSLLYRAPKLNAALEGQPTTLIRGGVVDTRAVQSQHLTQEDLLGALNKNGFDDVGDVDLCVLEPNGTFLVRGKSPGKDDLDREAILAELRKLTAEIAALRAERPR